MPFSREVFNQARFRRDIVGIDKKVPLYGGGYKTCVNLDNAASTPVLGPVLEKVNEFMDWYSSVHRGAGFKSQVSTRVYDEAHEIVGEFVKADLRKNSIIFVKNSTEAVNKVSYRMGLTKDDVILTTMMEHHSNDLPWRSRAKPVYAALDEKGALNYDDLEAKLRQYGDSIKLVSVSGASNVTGYKNDLGRIAALAHRAGVPVLVDGAQLIPHSPLDIKPDGHPEHIDYLVFSAHKMYAPFGTGVLIGPKHAFLRGGPEYTGGGTISIVTRELVEWAGLPDREEAGTPNVVGAVALAAAVKYLEGHGMGNIENHERALTSYALKKLANTFTAVPAAASASMMFIVLAVVFGYFVYQKGAPLGISSVIGVTLLFICIWLGNIFPLALSKNTWVGILMVYIFIASVAPVWILLQPRDYLNSYLLYAMIIGAVLGLLIMRPAMVSPAVTSFNVGGQWLFPMLFVTVACGAISGFHSLVGSGTTSKQIDNEMDTKLIGYGSMLIEGVLATIAIITAAYIGADKFAELSANGGPTNVFSDGIGNFMTSFGIPFEIGKSFVALAVSAFALTSLDTGTRLGRFIMEEFFYDASKEKQNPLANRYVSTLITVILGGWLAMTSWSVIWPVFGSANQLLAGLALLSVAIWLKKSGRNYSMFTLPMTFMMIVTLLALIQLMQANLASGNLILVVIPALLFVLAIVLAVQGYKEISKKVESPLKK